MQGMGSGSTAVALKHDLGDRIWPRNLTRGWVYRGGNTAKDIYRTIATGITGTPMPAHIETMKPEDIWKVVGYVDSIVIRTQPKVSEVIISRYIEGDLPKDPTDNKWAELPTGFIPLVSQIVEGERWFTTTLDAVSAKSFYNNDSIAILVEYDDPSQSPLKTPVDMFPQNEPDSLAIQFPTTIPTGMEKPYFLNGSEDGPVNLWKWTNSASGETIEALLAKGISKASTMDGAAQNVSVKSVYKDGTWKVLFTRKLNVEQNDNIDFEIGKYIPMAFNAWDGNNGEKDEQRAISIWYWLQLDPPPSMNVYLFPLFIGLLIAGGEVWLVFKARKD
jgi:DMSO reductase family type II enzyme heme b subunit